MPYIESHDRTNLFCTVWGEQGPPVVLVHAWGLNGDMWNYQVPALVAAGFRCVTFDRRGHGRSDRPWSSRYDLDVLADDLAAVIDRLALSGVTLVGHSMGAAEATRYVTRHGHGAVDRLVLSAPVTPCLVKSADNPEGLDAELFAGGRALMQRDVGAWVEASSAGYWGVDADVSDLMMRWTQRQIVDTPLAALLATNEAFVTADMRAELQRVDVPTLVIQGSADMSTPLELTGRRTAALVPDSRLVVVDGAGHGIYISEAERYNAELMAFIADTAARPSVAATA